MRVAVRARVASEPAASQEPAPPTRPRVPVQAVDSAPERDPAQPEGSAFSLDNTPIEAPSPSRLTLLPGGAATATREEVEEEAPQAADDGASPQAPPLAAAAETDPALPVPDRTATEMALGQSLAHVSVRSGAATREALGELDAEGAASDGDVFVARTPQPGTEEDEEEARAVLAHEVVHAAATAPPPASVAPTPVAEAAAAPEVAAESASEALAGAISEFHEPVREDTPAPAPVDRAEVRRASPGEAGVGLRRSATQRPPEPEAPRIGGGGGARARPSAPDSAGSAEVAEAPPEGRPAASERSGAGGGGGGAGAAAEEAEPEGGLTDLPSVVGSREVDVPAPPPPPLTGDGVDGMTSAFVSAPPSQKAFAHATLGDKLDSEAQESATALNESLPDLQQKMGGEGEMGEVESLDTGSTEAEDLGAEDAPLPDAEEAVAEVPENEEFAGNDSLFGWLRGVFGTSSASNAESIDEAIDNIETIDDSVESSPGPPPPVPLEGATDPALIDEQKTEGLGQAATGQGEARTAVVEGPGPEVVQPLEMDEAVEIPVIEQQAAEQPAPADGVEQYKQLAPPGDVQAAFDEQNAATMEANLAEAKTKADEATATRDADWETANLDAQEDNQGLVDTAQQDQEAAVEEQRGRIQDERQSTLERQQEEVDRVQDEAGDAETEQQREIDDRVAADEAEIERKYDEAEEEADTEVEKGEEDAEKEKRDAEREAENQSWWDKIASWISDAISALVDVVTSIIDLVADAINAILDAVRDLVVGLIELAADFIKAAISAFGELLKGLVDALLGDIFPELAAALTEAIDGAVELAHQAVDAVAEVMIDGVNAVLDVVQGALNAVLDVFMGAITLIGAVIGAALTGDWGEVGRLLLEGALSVAGISPEEFYGFIGQVQETFDTIVNDPMGFLGNVFGAIALGFNQFVTNILDHLQTGFFEWLVGPLGEMGITLPETWDIWGILGLILQVLGLTQEGIRGVVVEELGETAGTVFDYVWRYVDALITGGWQGLWEEIQGDLSNLWEMFVDGIKGWIIEKIITEATLKLLSLLDPTGISAIVQVVLTAWRIYTFMQENLARVREIVTTVVGAIHNIAMGVLQPAGDAVEGVLGRLVPIAISLLANLFGIGGIANKIRDVIEGIRTRVRNALKSLIRRIRGLFGGGGDATAPGQDEEAGDEDVPDGAVGRTHSWSAGGESHRVWVELEGQDATVKMASGPGAPIETELSEMRAAVRAAKLDSEDEAPALAALDTADRTEDAAETEVEREVRDAEDGEGADVTVEADSAVTQTGVAVETAHRAIKESVSVTRFRAFSTGSAWVLQTWDMAERKFATREGVSPTETEDTDAKIERSSHEPFSTADYEEYMRAGGGIPAASAGGPTADTVRGDVTKARENAQLNARVTAQSYAVVEPWVAQAYRIGGEPGVDEELRAAVGSDIYAFLQGLAEGTNPGGITRARFNELFQVTANSEFVKGRYRAASPGMHEWLPTNLVNAVVQTADQPQHMMNAAELVEWQHHHRTPTWKLVFAPSKWQATTVGDVTMWEPQGHTGAVYNNGSPRTVGQSTFHNELRAEMTPTQTIQQMARGMRQVAERWIWDGSAPPASKQPVAPVEFRGDGGSTYRSRKNNQAALKRQALDDIIEAANA